MSIWISSFNSGIIRGLFSFTFDLTKPQKNKLQNTKLIWKCVLYTILCGVLSVPEESSIFFFSEDDEVATVPSLLTDIDTKEWFPNGFGLFYKMWILTILLVPRCYDGSKFPLNVVLLQEKCPDGVISQHSDWEWPDRYLVLCDPLDLTICDFSPYGVFLNQKWMGTIS